MPAIIPLFKHIGETSLQAIERLRACYPNELAGVKLSYAGRLDPMAEGLLLVLVGEENKNREKYLGLDKEYTVEGLLGFESDTYDLMGIIRRVHLPKVYTIVGGGEKVPKFLTSEINKYLECNIGVITQKYPAYSVKTVRGKSLWVWAKEGRLNEIEIPTREVEVYSAHLETVSTIDKGALFEQIKHRIERVRGDFRQEDAIRSWESALATDETEYPFFKLRVSCSSGTYIRTLVHELGRELGTGALALRITRTKIGEYVL